MAKKYYRLAPCPSYDIAGWESWLEDMAREGCTPTGFDNFQPVIRFDPMPPKEYRYRMEPKQQREWEPDQHLLALAQELGWEYVGQRGSFFVFRTDDPNAPELHTEPETQAMSLRYLRKLFRDRLLIMAVELAVLGGLLLPQFGWVLVEYGSLYVLSLFLGILSLLAGGAVGLVRIRKLQKALRGGQPMAHRRDWREGARFHKFLSALTWPMLLLLMLCWFSNGMRELGFGEVSLAEYPGQPPFVTLDELGSGMEIDHISNNVARSWSDPLFPVCVSWLDGASVTWPDGEWTAGLQIVQYCEARTPWLAELVARGYLSAYRPRYDTGPKELPQLGVDYAAGYWGEYGLNRAVLVEGNTVVCIELQMDCREFTLEHWLELMAQRISIP